MMINWESINYNVSHATRDYDNIVIESDNVTPIQPNASFLPIREQLINARNRIFEENQLDGANRLGYEFDLMFGLELYQILNTEVGFTNRAASKDDIWRYLSINVIPDIVHSRWGMNEDHFYKNSRRIWLKTIWWYVELAWHKDVATTYNLLKDNTTDTILQLVERPGIGYYVDLYREIMLQYKSYEDKDRNLFRSILKLNTARLAISSPELVEGGIEAYVEELFNTVTEV